MRTVKRYQINGEGYTYRREDPQGFYVKFEDIEDLLEQKEVSMCPNFKCGNKCTVGALAWVCGDNPCQITRPK
jgi:hypothetical protein